jgi:hypothetical protein
MKKHGTFCWSLFLFLIGFLCEMSAFRQHTRIPLAYAPHLLNRDSQGVVAMRQ